MLPDTIEYYFATTIRRTVDSVKVSIESHNWTVALKGPISTRKNSLLACELIMKAAPLNVMAQARMRVHGQLHTCEEIFLRVKFSRFCD